MCEMEAQKVEAVMQMVWKTVSEWPAEWVRRVVGTIWNVGAGDQGSLPVWNANSGKPLKVD